MTAVEFVVQKFGTADGTGKTPLAKLLDEDLKVLVAEANALAAKIDTFRQSANGQGTSSQP